MLRNKKIVLCVTGGIAAYKCPELVRLLVKAGAQVRVVMTRAASDFVTARALAVVSRNEVTVDFFDSSNNWNNHVALAEWADLVLMAPLTANTLAKMAAGQCDNIVLAVYLSARSPVVVAPAMDLEMYRHATVKENLGHIRGHGVVVIPPESGELASGLTGEGRMAAPESIVAQVSSMFPAAMPLSGKKVLLNAGPTYEAIDPVRFIGNRSSGKMGVALAEAFYALGADVELVLGPSPLTAISEGITVVRVEDAEAMRREMTARFGQADIAVCSAAVADYRPEHAENRKIKKREEKLTISLVRTPDILAELVAMKKKRQILVGFALETEELEKNALKKLAQKNLDVVVANMAGVAGSGIGVDDNAVTLIDRSNKITKFELKSKQAVARDIVSYLIEMSK